MNFEDYIVAACLLAWLIIFNALGGFVAWMLTILLIFVVAALKT